MKADLRSEKVKREELDREIDRFISGLTAILLIATFMIILYTMFWSML